MGRWRRLVVLQAPHGPWESMLYLGLGFALMAGLGLLVIVPVLFVGCGPGLCGFFGG